MPPTGPCIVWINISIQHAGKQTGVLWLLL
jgi:hypothetical protein